MSLREEVFCPKWLKDVTSQKCDIIRNNIDEVFGIGKKKGGKVITSVQTYDEALKEGFEEGGTAFLPTLKGLGIQPTIL